jgi:hypothetical protein
MAESIAEDPFAGSSPARLIPTAGIRGQEEQERRATSALLAVLKAVPEFAHALLKELGAPKGRVSTFTEIQLKDGEGKVSIRDGAIVVERGKTRWGVLVEVKTSDAQLADEQVNRYLDHARPLGFSGVLTISNRIRSGPTDSPVVVDRRKLRSLNLWHLSWWRILTEAVVQHRHRGVSDPDQAWILGELIAFWITRHRAPAASPIWATSGYGFATRRITAPCEPLTPRPGTSSNVGSSSANTSRLDWLRTSGGT